MRHVVATRQPASLRSSDSLSQSVVRAIWAGCPMSAIELHLLGEYYGVVGVREWRSAVAVPVRVPPMHNVSRQPGVKIGSQLRRPTFGPIAYRDNVKPIVEACADAVRRPVNLRACVARRRLDSPEECPIVEPT